MVKWDLQHLQVRAQTHFTHCSPPNNDQFEKVKTLTCLEEMGLCVIPLYKHGNLKIIYTLLLVELSYFV